MPPLPIGIHPKAIAEARAALQWYRARSPAAADAFLSEIDHAIDQIAEAPDRWPNYVQGTRRYPLHRFPYSVVYRKQDQTVQIIAVAHGRRKPGYWKTR